MFVPFLHILPCFTPFKTDAGFLFTDCIIFYLAMQRLKEKTNGFQLRWKWKFVKSFNNSFNEICVFFGLIL